MKIDLIHYVQNRIEFQNTKSILLRKFKSILELLYRDIASKVIVCLIFIVNSLFIMAHLGRHFAAYLGAGDDFFLIKYFHLYRVDVDAGLAEWFMYLQGVACALLLLGVFRATRQPVHAAWALIFLFVVADDAFMIHERLGAYLATAFGLPALPGLRPDDSGELLVWAAAGAVLLGILWRGFARSGRNARAAGGVLGLVFATLVFFAVVVDMLHIALGQLGTRLYKLLPIIEDGGEMLSMGLACAIALLLYRHPIIAGGLEPSGPPTAAR